MGKFTGKMNGSEMMRLLKIGLIAECDNVTEDTEFSIRRDGRYGWNFVVTLEGDDIRDNEDEWHEIVRKDNREENKRLGLVLGGTVLAVIAVVLLAEYVLAPMVQAS